MKGPILFEEAKGRPAAKSSDGGATTDPWVDATSHQSGRAEVVTPVLGTFCYLCLRAGQRWDWRRECQSIPVDVSAIFHSRASEPTVLATRYWASSPARAVLGEQEIARLLALLGITHHDRHNVRLTEHHGQACRIEHGLYPHRAVLMAGSRSIAKS